MPRGAHRWRRHCMSTLLSAVFRGPCKGRSHLAPMASVHPVHPDPARTPLRARRSPVSCVGIRKLRSQTHLRNMLDTPPFSDAVAPAQPGHSVAGRGLGGGALHSHCHHRPPDEIVQGPGDSGSQHDRLFPGLQNRFAHGLRHPRVGRKGPSHGTICPTFRRLSDLSNGAAHVGWYRAFCPIFGDCPSGLPLLFTRRSRRSGASSRLPRGMSGTKMCPWWGDDQRSYSSIDSSLGDQA